MSIHNHRLPLDRNDPRSRESIRTVQPDRTTMIFALAYLWHHAEDREDFLMLADALGLSELLISPQS